MFLTRLLFLEGVAIDSGVSASDCGCGSGSRRLRKPVLLLDEGGILHVVRGSMREKGYQEWVLCARLGYSRRGTKE